MLTFTTFLIVCPLVFLGGFVDAVAGGGGLISLPAYMLAGIPVHSCIATNKLSSGMGTALTTYRYHKLGYIEWKRSALCIVCALIGSAAGANLALMIDDYIFKIIMLIVLPITGAYVIFRKGVWKEQEPYGWKRTITVSMVVALVIGAYDGFYGPGTGTFLILLLTSLAHMSVQDANGTCKTINLTTNLTSLAVFLYNGQVIIILGLVAGLFGIAGNYIGTRFFEKGGAKVVKPVMIIVILLFFVKVLLEVI